jgi:hypothetical protein
MHETLDMHYYCMGTSFHHIKEQHLLKAFQLVNPSLTLPTRKRLAGTLLDICFKQVKIEVNKLLSHTAQFLCITTSDGLLNISDEAAVNAITLQSLRAKCTVLRISQHWGTGSQRRLDCSRSTTCL